MAGIEFVDPPTDVGADEVDSGPHRAWSRRAKATVGAALLAAVTAVVLIPALHRSETDRHPQAAPSRVAPLGTPSPGTAPPDSDPPASDPLGSDPLGSDPSGTDPPVPVLILDLCPNADACEIRLVLPVPVLAAVRAALPGVAAVAGGSVLVRGRQPTLRSRQVKAADGRLTVEIRVRPAALHELPTAETTTAGGGITRTSTEIDGGFAVTVTVSAPDNRDPGPTVVRVLAADRRLLAVD